MITVVGEALIDLVGVGGLRFEAHPGGSPLNTAVGIARLGVPTTVLARFADDAFGRILRQHALDNGVSIEGSPHAAEPTTLAVVTIDDAGRASYDFYLEGTADWQWSDEELASLPAGTQILHTGSLAAWTDPGQARIAALVDRVREQVLVSFDPNIRPRFVGTPARGRALVERSVAAAHVVKASDQDAGWLYPGESMESIAANWASLGPDLVVITCGGEGVVAMTGGGVRIDRPAVPIELADTVGAGDGFTSGLLATVMDRGLARPHGLSDVDPAVLAEILDQAGLVAALVCERPGSDPPTAEQLAAAQHRIPR